MAEQKKKTRSKRNRSAQKQARQAVHRRVRNRSVKSKISAAAKQLRSATGDRATLVTAAYVEIDRAARKGVLHKRTAARRKSRLARLANKQPAA
ncbi:30S ribosomal protein S20 [bacterium]|nr:30S ribosomal protein S20 [bacterium]